MSGHTPSAHPSTSSGRADGVVPEPKQQTYLMTTLAKTLATLEFDKILARLAGLCQTTAGRELALALRPSSDYAEVVRRQRLTAEARRLLELKPNLSLGGARDVRPHARKGALAGILEPTELLDV